MSERYNLNVNITFCYQKWQTQKVTFQPILAKLLMGSFLGHHISAIVCKILLQTSLPPVSFDRNLLNFSRLENLQEFIRPFYLECLQFNPRIRNKMYIGSKQNSLTVSFLYKISFHENNCNIFRFCPLVLYQPFRRLEHQR